MGIDDAYFQFDDNDTLRESLAGDLDDLLYKLFPASHAEFEADPFLSAGEIRHTFGAAGVVQYGVIQYGLPALGWYRVALHGGEGVAICRAMESGSSPTLLGTRDASSYQPHDEVLVHLHGSPTEMYGVILGSVPSVVDDGNVHTREWLSQGSNVGVLRDGHYLKYITDLLDEGGAVDFGGHRPLDQTSFDWGKTALTGMSLHVDPFSAWLRLDEMCGISLSYYDQHLCVAGYSMDVLTAAQSSQHRDDEGETTYYLGESPYPWELMGRFEPGLPAGAEQADPDVLYGGPVGKYEPDQEDQWPFFRYEEYGGYLGQGRIRQMSLPPQTVTTSDVNTLSSEALVPIGVFREHIGLEGAWSVSAAKEIVLSRKSILPVAKRIRLQEDLGEDADSAANENYKFAGEFGDADDHLVGDRTLEGDRQELLSTAAVLDVGAHETAWKTLAAFHYHDGDFVLREEHQQDSGDSVSSNQSLPDFSQLSSQMWLPRPQAKHQHVDHRYGDVAYYEVMQHFTMTDDGGVVIQAGHGEEIRMAQGNIELSAPGNVHIRVGKQVVTLAGDDVIIRARNSVDVTATEKDVRIKSERNMQLLSGNGGQGGMLLENKASGREQNYPPAGGEQIQGSGIVFKAANSLVAALAGEVYIRTGNEHIAKGNIVLDAAKGEADIHLIGRDLNKLVHSAESTIFRSGSRTTSVSTATANTHLVGSNMSVNGSLRVEGQALVKDGVQCSDGHFQSPQGGQVGRVRAPQVLRHDIYVNTSEYETSQTDRADSLYTDVIRQNYYRSTQIGSDEQGKEISCSLREEAEYCTLDFALANTHYQTLMTASGIGTVWKENVVKYQDEREQMPWPGKKKWAEESTLHTLPPSSFNMYDVSQGVVTDRSAGEDAKLGPFVPKTPDSEYKVIDC